MNLLLGTVILYFDVSETLKLIDMSPLAFFNPEPGTLNRST
jgi:hypothetical protein